MSGWINTTLGEIADGPQGFIDGPFGSNLPASDYVDAGVPVIRGSNLSLGVSRFSANGFVFVSEQTAERLRRSMAKANDIVFTKKGTIGQTGFVPNIPQVPVFILSSNQMRLRVDLSKADPLFVYYYVSQRTSVDKVIRDSEVTGVPKTNLAYFRNFPIALPSLMEQRAIASILGTLDDKIDLNHRMNETLETMARAIFKDWFVDLGPTRAKMEGRAPYLAPRIWELFPDRLDNEGRPQGWIGSIIGQEVAVVGGSTPSTKNPEYWNGHIAWATPKDLSSLSSPVLLSTERQITDAGLSQISSGLLPVGTVLLSSRAPIGYIAIAQTPTAINQGFIGMVCDRRLSNTFVWLWTQANMETVLQNANGSTFQEISKTNFRPIVVTIATPDVLQSFDQAVGPLFSRVVSNEKENHSLATTREFLLPKLMSGEVRLKDAAKVAEAAL
jgi:type I restriction enzyme, S subunit